MPLQFTLGGVANGIKWGLGLQYENAKATGLVSSDDKKSVVVDPSYMMTGYRAGLVRDELEVSAGWSRATWKVGTDGTLKAGGADAKIGLLDGASQQMNDALDVTVRYQAKAAQWFVAFEQSKSKLTLWDNTANAANGVAGTSTDRDEFMKGQTISFGAENSQSINENVKHFMKSWFTYLKSTENLNKQKTEVTDMSLSTAHGFEAGLSSWATLRGGVQSTFWGSMSHKITDFAADNQGGTSDTNEVKASNMLRAVAYPTLGMGFKFGAYTIDATFAQDNTGSIGFTDKILGKVEVTAQF